MAALPVDLQGRRNTAPGRRLVFRSFPGDHLQARNLVELNGLAVRVGHGFSLALDELAELKLVLFVGSLPDPNGEEPFDNIAANDT